MGKEQLLNYVQNLVSLTGEEMEQLLSGFSQLEVKKGQFLVEPGLLNEFRPFVVKGAFRSYFVCGDSQEHTIQFAIENGWVLDFNSYINQQPARLFIAALEDSTILQISFEREQELKMGYYKFETLFRKIAEEGLAFEQSRILICLKYDAQARYERFLLSYPELAQRMPQSVIASYLGINKNALPSEK